jgi:hypothetical protein
VPLWILPKTALWDGFDIILVAAGITVQFWALLDLVSCVAKPGRTTMGRNPLSEKA